MAAPKSSFKFTKTPVKPLTQQFLPGLETWSETEAPAAPRKRRRTIAKPTTKRSPSVEKLLAGASPKVRKLFAGLREQLLSEEGLTESVPYDESSGSFMPTYEFDKREVLRLHLDPVLAATLTLDPGERQLAYLLASPELSDTVKTKAIRCARKSGHRIFLAFIARNATEANELLSLVRSRVELARLNFTPRPPTPIRLQM